MIIKKWMLFFFSLIIFLIHIPVRATHDAPCLLLNTKLNPKDGQTLLLSDPLSLLIQSASNCPDDVFKFRRLLKEAGLNLKTTMVANRGFHNPAEGSFSIFEIVTGTIKNNQNIVVIDHGDFFFGHFTAVDDQGNLDADQAPLKGSLMIEAIAWDVKKGSFNFYELRGNGKSGQWYYRGDSTDIFSDNTLLHRQLDPTHPKFGDRLRCSACHDAGGPIMKELNTPHNDWWDQNRKLDFGGRNFTERLKEILKTLVSSDALASAVIEGVKKLYLSDHFSNTINSFSLQEQLRPLFCPQEVNFQSDKTSNDENNPEVIIPSAFFIDSRLLSQKNKKGIIIARSDYVAALNALQSHFPETNLIDADHAWLTPVKAKSDKLAIDQLIYRGLIDKKFVADVLAIDMTNPVFSKKRCLLLKYVPNVKTKDWRDIFIRHLSQSKRREAQELIANLTDPSRTIAYYQNKSEKFLDQCRIKLKNYAHVEMMVRLLSQRRAEISASEISANPKGKILEPGFRIIFPENSDKRMPGILQLTQTCDVTKSQQ